MTRTTGKAIAVTLLAAGLFSGAVLAQDQDRKAAPGEMPMMNSDQMPGMQGGGMGGMMGMMSAMTEMMQTCNKMMQAALPDQQRGAEPEKDG